ncbi:MAG: ABC transporter substrate-binding protein [Lachnospiraceae bacterium]|jgi:NitT/TauT family transport system substrate-binding protein|nr:ABC transporter substrate-binding protein [Lachnospiraceae bacterium]
MKRRAGFFTMTVFFTAAAISGCSPQRQSQPKPTTQAALPPEQESTGNASPAEETSAVSSSSQTDGKPLNFSPIKLRIAYMPNMGSASAIIAARDGGFFAEVGITPELVQFQGGPAEIAAMASGDIDISQIGHGAHALCIEGQAQIFGLDLYGKSDEVIANKEKGIEKMTDLAGKRVAVTAGTSSEIVLDLALEKAGMSREDLELVELDANGAVTAMISGNVDACASWSPSTNIIRDRMGEKAVTLAGNEDFFDKVAFPGSFIATDGFGKENRESLVRFYAAILKAMDYRKENVEEVCRWLAKEIEAEPEDILATKDNYEWLVAQDIRDSLDDGSLKRCYESQQQVFIDSGRITDKVDTGEYVMFSVMEDALALYEDLQ